MIKVSKNYVGVDVSKKFLDVFIYPANRSFRVANDKNGLKNLSKVLDQFQIGQIVCEASGGYESPLVWHLQEKFKIWRVEPRRIKAFIISEGIYAKTDASDARMMALFAMKKQQSYTPIALSEQEKKLQSLIKRRHDLNEMISNEKKRKDQNYDVFCLKSIKKIIKTLEKAMEQIQEEIDDILKKDAKLNQKMERLQSVKGIGKITAQALIAELPELGMLEGKKAAALVGLAPYTQQSGSWRGKSFIRGGRASLRKAIYMAALTASRSNPVLAKFYQRLISAGKKPKVALIAVARKLILIVNSMIKYETNWQNV